ncbi:Predicted DNA-binding transcriptional regulator YafY, contains an HTH and WYL domains [Arachidicoccus rhizosphaerae]|uniref:Predicted DNA-binding transcriptional regulator YafY, contains an HTH and WYL domains n=1 Tax=Arachidicoccus rhizosphaerae TaxID=551991 RepID=A0A1H4BNI5_9BACT|nr:WYL domain-containing transcriptional regulator [Arachidicoccus rhizosphaerae]SEA49618.1 Predicted DNA-binding transcriptional regulator YafY, contains an HTH and WYL domains [Arachidicoccus rhizosphaerae]
MSFKKNQSFYLINQLIQNRKTVSSFEIQQKLSDYDLPSSERTVQRLISDLKDMGLELAYNPQTRKYDFNAMDSTDQTKLLALMVTADFMQSVAAFPTNTLQYIDFDDRLVAKGAHFLPDLFLAIQQRKWIEIVYQRYETETPKTHRLAPLFLKEFNYRWYLLAAVKNGHTDEKKMPLLFGLDRIQQLTLTGQKFNKNLFQSLSEYTPWSKGSIKKPMDLFDDVIGVRFTNEAVQQVKLKFSPEQAPFVQSQPWHSTQMILANTEEEFTIEICVRPNDDLMTMILAQHGNVEVLEPLSLREKVQSLLQKSLEKYKTHKKPIKKKK